MERAVITRVFLIGTCGAAFAIGCDQKGPTGPTQFTAPPAATTPLPAEIGHVRVTNISPQLGTAAGGTPVFVNGSGFEAGAAVTLGGAASGVTILSSTELTAVAPPHQAGIVDVMVINPSGGRGILTGGFTYATVGEGPTPSITAITPNVGTVSGGGFVVITGGGFERGAIVRLGITPLRTYDRSSDSTKLTAQASPHVAGSVDVVVVNPDGQIATLTRGYTYAPPGSLNFSGQWKGFADDQKDDHLWNEIQLTIEKNLVTHISCNSDIRSLSPPHPIIDDAFSVSEEDRLLITGTFISATEARGRINFPPCGSSWTAARQ